MSEVKLKPTGGGAGSISLKAPASTTGNADFPLVLPQNDGDADQYLKTNGSGTLSWGTVSSGTTVGGSSAVTFNDGVKANWGTDNDLQLSHSSGNSLISNITGYLVVESNAGNLFLDGNPDVNIRVGGDGGEENSIVCKQNGAVEVYYDNTKKFETTSSGSAFYGQGGSHTDVTIYGAEAQDANLNLFADDGDDNADKWRILSSSGGGWFLQNYTSGSWENNIKAVGNGVVELYHDNALAGYTATEGLHVKGTENRLTFSSDDVWIQRPIGDTMAFTTGGTERFRLASDGKPSFEIANSYMQIDKDNTGVIIEFQTGGSAKGNIGIGSSDVSYNQTSDYRLKENVTAISDGITRVKQLKPSKFNWISDDTNTLVDGFLAHEVSSVVPNAITGDKDAVDSDGNPVHQMIDPSKMIPLLTAALKEAIARIEVLEAAS